MTTASLKATTSTSTQPAARIRDFVRRRTTLLALSGLTSALASALAVAPYVFIYFIAVALLETGGGLDLAWVVGMAVASVLVAVLRGALTSLSTSLSHSAAYDILYDLRIALAEKLASLPFGFFGERNTGTLKKIIHEDVEQLEEGIAHIIPDAVSGVLTPLATLAVLGIIDWRMSLALIGSTLITVVLYGRMSNGSRTMYGEYNQLVAHMNAAVIQYINGMRVIKAFTQTGVSFEKLRQAVVRMEAYYLKMQKKLLPTYGMVMMMSRAGLLFVLPVGAWLLATGQLTAATFILFVVVGMGFNRPIFQLMYGLGTAFWQVSAASKRVSEILTTPSLSEPAHPQGPVGHTIAFHQVGLRYTEAGASALHEVSFEVPEGTITALVGPSGAGKTSAARLIARFWDVTAGSVTIGGVDVRQMSTRTLMDQVAFVFQDVFLFNESVLENIRVGRPGASDDEVIAAAKAARCHTFISEDLEHGYQTLVGENGSRLSGGQRQRLSIARAILKDAPIVVLDEATAFVDPENELLIQEALSALIARGKTLIVIAHRLSTITHVDQIVVMDQGRVVARGKHTDLLHACPLYARLWSAHIGAQGYAFHTDRSEPTLTRAAVAAAPTRPAAESAGTPDYGDLDEHDGFFTMVRKLVRGQGPVVRRVLWLKLLQGIVTAVPSLAAVLMVLDVLAGTLSVERAVGLSVLAISAYGLQYVTTWVSMYSLFFLDTAVQRGLRLFLAHIMRRLPLGFFTRRDVGSVDALFTTHIQFLELHLIIDLGVMAVVTPITVFVSMLFWDWRLALAAAAGMPLAFWVLRRVNTTFRRVWRDQSDARTRANARMVEYLFGIPVIRAFNLGGARLNRFTQALDTYRLASRRTITTIAPAMSAYTAAVEAGFAAVLVVGALLWAAGQVSAGVLVTCLILAATLYLPLMLMGDLIGLQRIMQNAVRAVGEFIRTPILPEPVEPRLPQGTAISFRDVHFTYEQRPVLRGVSFDIPERSLTALVGPSGAGKTTIANLIARFWDVDSGAILIGGEDVRQLSTDTLLAQMTMVFQDVYLFADTIRNNIRLGNPSATDAEVEQAAKRAQIHDFIMTLPEGYDTVVGEGGSSLSGGQKQRVSIARAILKDARIVILDEATASVDPENEAQLQRAFDALTAEKTLIVIAHRLTTIQNADQILVIDDGQVIQRGRHTELIQVPGLYQTFWNDRLKVGQWGIHRAA